MGRRAFREGDPKRLRGRRSEAVRVVLLGGFEVWVGQRAVGEDGWRLRKAASLVKLLALAPGHRMHREAVIDRLWPGLDPEAQANNLRQSLHVARHAFGGTPGGASRYLSQEDGIVA